jgi:putative ABC transport system permease protein
VPLRFRMHIAGYGARDLIVFAEIGTSVGLIVWTAMAFTLLGELRGMRLMLPADRIVAISVPDTDLATIISRVAAIPGVIRASSALTGLGGGLPVQAQADDGRTVRLSRIPVGEGFFDTVGTRIVRGRAFDPTEAHAASGVAILSQTAAQQLSRDSNVIGLHLRITDHGSYSVVVIGVVADSIDYGGLARAGLMPGDMYVPFRPSGTDAMVVVRTAADPHALLKAIADAARTPLAVRPPRSVIASEEFERNGPTGNNALGATVLFRIVGGFALVSLLLAGSGIFAVVSQSVAQRTREFGIRMAIGATPRAVLALVLGRETRLIAAGIGCGVVFTIGITRAFFVQLTTLAAQMPALLTGALLFSTLVAATAVAFATWRIVRLEPAAVLRRP